ncbi:MAG: hypothetical protein VR64_07305 [Desulfatitalea sp. BRH_c12]|nr:MAG: hypothetical protein VR64_07305 [Desulfatitalea sp. BRH_c12]
MSWVETLTKETFYASIREAMKPQIDEIRNDVKALVNRLSDVEQRLFQLEGTVDGASKTTEANIRAYEASVRALFFEFKSEVLQRRWTMSPAKNKRSE